jgi:hypothetical protein
MASGQGATLPTLREGLWANINIVSGGRRDVKVVKFGVHKTRVMDPLDVSRSPWLETTSKVQRGVVAYNEQKQKSSRRGISSSAKTEKIPAGNASKAAKAKAKAKGKGKGKGKGTSRGGEKKVDPSVFALAVTLLAGGKHGGKKACCAAAHRRFGCKGDEPSASTVYRAMTKGLKVQAEKTNLIISKQAEWNVLFWLFGRGFRGDSASRQDAARVVAMLRVASPALRAALLAQFKDTDIDFFALPRNEQLALAEPKMGWWTGFMQRSRDAFPSVMYEYENETDNRSLMAFNTQNVNRHYDGLVHLLANLQNDPLG